MTVEFAALEHLKSPVYIYNGSQVSHRCPLATCYDKLQEWPSCFPYVWERERVTCARACLSGIIYALFVGF